MTCVKTCWLERACYLPKSSLEPTDDQIEAIVAQIVERVHPIQIIVFGSTARGEAHAGSDVDLLVVMPEGAPMRDTARELYRHITGVKIPYDILVTTSEILEKYADHPGLIYRSILQEGKVLYAAE